MSDSVLGRLKTLLAGHSVAFEFLEHDPVYTSEEAAAIRGATLASGAKALICRTDEQFSMFVLPADRRLASKLVRQSLAIRSLRFATRDELAELTGLTPGSIPPLGSLFGLPTYCDHRLADSEHINFNAGDHAISLSVRYADYLVVEQPQLGSFSE